MSGVIGFVLGFGLGFAVAFMFAHPDKWTELKALFKKNDQA